jgi:hypothetical protein
MHPFLIYWIISTVFCGLVMVAGVVVDKWKGKGTTAKDVMVGGFWACVPLASTLIGVILFFYVLSEVLKKAETIQVVRGRQ